MGAGANLLAAARAALGWAERPRASANVIVERATVPTVNKAVLDIYEIMEGTATHRRVTAFHAFIVVLIALNVLFVVIETEESIKEE